MLVLSRKVGEVVFIGEGISVKVVAIDRGHVRIGIEAPDGVVIARDNWKGHGPHLPPPQPPLEGGRA